MGFFLTKTDTKKNMWVCATLLFFFAEYLAHSVQHATQPGVCCNTPAVTLHTFKCACACLVAVLFFVPTVTQLALTVSVLCSAALRAPHITHELNARGFVVRKDLQESVDLHIKNPVHSIGLTSLFWDAVFNTRHPSLPSFDWFSSSAALSLIPGLSAIDVSEPANNLYSNLKLVWNR